MDLANKQKCKTSVKTSRTFAAWILDGNFPLIPQTELAMKGSDGIAKGPWKVGGDSSLILIKKNQYLVTLALVSSYLVTLALFSSRRNRRSRAQTLIFTIENQHVLVQMAPQASWPSELSADSLAIWGSGNLKFSKPQARNDPGEHVPFPKYV